MVGIYVRVSTAGQNIDGQKQEIERWLKGNGVANARWYIDKATGNNLKRPAFERLQKDIFNGEIETVVCWKLDRLSRALRDGINVLADWCDKGLRVVATSQMIDFNGSLGKMLAAVLLGIAEMEQEVRRERQAVGIAAAKARGVYFGRQCGTTKATPRRAHQLREKGLTVEEISQAIGVSVRTVFRYLEQQSAA
jgi:DNA invertase Pin-like site-specific DNA recombinase